MYLCNNYYNINTNNSESELSEVINLKLKI